MNGASYEWAQRVADFDRANMKITERGGGVPTPQQQDPLAAAKRLVEADPSLMAAFRDWYEHGELSVSGMSMAFDRWFSVRLDVMWNEFCDPATPEALYAAARIQAQGVPLANDLADLEELTGAKTDSTAYVEDGIVHASVWLTYGDHAKTADRAVAVRDALKRAGFTAYIWIDDEADPECYTEATVCAEMPFTEYFNRYGKEG